LQNRTRRIEVASAKSTVEKTAKLEKMTITGHIAKVVTRQRF